MSDDTGARPLGYLSSEGEQWRVRAVRAETALTEARRAIDQAIRRAAAFLECTVEADEDQRQVGVLYVVPSLVERIDGYLALPADRRAEADRIGAEWLASEHPGPAVPEDTAPSHSVFHEQPDSWVEDTDYMPGGHLHKPEDTTP